MIDTKLYGNLVWRTLLPLATGACFAVLGFTVLKDEFIFTIIVGLILVALEVYYLVRYVLSINRLLVDLAVMVTRGQEETMFLNEENQMTSGLVEVLNQMKRKLSNAVIEREQQKRLMDIVVDTMEPGLICLDRNDRVVFLNKSASEYFGVSSSQSLDHMRKHHANVVESMQGTREGRPVILSLEGKKMSLRCTQFKLGNEAYLLYAIYDIQHESEVQEIESWQKLVRVMNHEILNSMGPVISLSKSLRKSLHQPEKIQNGLKTIEYTTERLITFIEQYRNISTLPTPEIAPFLLKELLHQLETLFSEELRATHIELSKRSDPSIEVLGDKKQLEMVLVNLIRNAIDSLKESAAGIICISTGKEEEMITILLEDNGQGIPQGNEERIFVPFYTTKKEGNGIGLNISRQIMKNHHGNLELLESGPDRTVFKLSLPTTRRY
ncbi:PAS domain-containing sensor histidine kinase [Bacteroidota bacterium]